ncbi:MAG: hypothetical protein WA958_05385 [Tunicatimonas sp.]
MLPTRALLLLYLMLANFSLFAQVSPDSLLRQTTTGELLLSREDSVKVKFQQIRTRSDSLRHLPGRTADSLAVVRYVARQQDSITLQVQRWEAKKDSLLSPLDTLQQRIDATQRRVRTFQDSLYQKVSIQQVTGTIEAKEILPTEVANAVPSSSVIEDLPPVNLPKVASQLPDLPPPIHAVREHTTAWQDKLSTYPATLSEYQGKASQYTKSLNQGSEALEQQVLQRAPESELLQQRQDGLFDFSDRQAFAQQQQRAQLQQRVVASAKDHFAEHGEALQDAQEKLGKLKKKYSDINGDTQQKRSSLQGTPLGKRLVYGGTIQLQRVPSLSIDLAPQLAYQWNKRISSGVGVVYRLAPEGGIKKMRQQLASNNAIYGGRIYAEYEVVRSLLLHGEYERLSQRVTATSENIPGRQWQTSLLAGVGKTYQIAGKWQGSVLLLYNFRHGQQTIHSRPWVVRFGFQRVGSK